MVSDKQYGSDEHGLVWGYLFYPNKPAVAIDSHTAEQWIQSLAATPQDSFLWLHFSLSNAECIRWFHTHLNLPEAFTESLHTSVGSTRIELDEDSLVAVVHDVLFEQSLDFSAISTVSICVQPNIMISARLRPLRSLDVLRNKVKNGITFRSTVDILANLLVIQSDVLVEIVRKITVSVDTLEDKILANRITTTRGELGQMRRGLVRLQRLLAPEPTALFRLLNRSPRWIQHNDILDLRQAAEEFSSAVADSVSLVERIRLLQEELTALVGERGNQTLFVLTLVTALALPFTIVSSLFGMNVGGIPFAESAHGFTLIILLLTIVTGLSAYIIIKRSRQ